MESSNSIQIRVPQSPTESQVIQPMSSNMSFKTHMLPSCSPPPSPVSTVLNCRILCLPLLPEVLTHHIITALGLMTSFSSFRPWNTKIRGKLQVVARASLWAYLLVCKAITIILADLIWENKWNNSCKASKCS